MEIKSRK